MPAKYLVDLSQLSPVEQDELAGIGRHLRALITNLRVYPQGHGVVVEVAERVGEHLAAAARAHGSVLLDARETMLRANGEVLFEDRPERDTCARVAAWLRERGLTNLQVTPDVKPVELLRLFGWLSSTQPRDARESFVGGIPDVLETENLRLNVRVRGARTEELEVYLEEALDAVDLEGMVRNALQDGRLALDEGLDPSNLRGELLELIRREMADATDPGAGAVDPDAIDWSRIDLSQVLDSETLEDLVADYMDSQFDPGAALDGTEDLEDRLEEISEALESTLNTEDLGPLKETLLQHAAGMVSALVPDAVGEFLADPAAAGSLEQRIQERVLASLTERERQRSEVLRTLVDRLRPEEDTESFHASIAVMEELIPDMLGSPQRADAIAGLAAIAAAAHDDALTPDCRIRAESSLAALAGPRVMPVVVEQLQSSDDADQAAARELLRRLGPEAVLPLLEILRSSLDQGVRLAVVAALTDLGQLERDAGARAPRSMIPLLRELRNADHNPWYFTRNLVEVLVQVAAPAFEKELLSLLDSDLDYRVLAAVAEGLATAESEEIRAALRRVLFGGKIIVPEAFEALLARELEGDRAVSLAELDRMLTSGVAPDRIERVAISALARHLGAESTEFLGKVLTTRSRILRRPPYSEEHRLMAVEALATLDDAGARSLLEKACKDPSEEVRRRAALRLEQGPSSSPPGSSSQEVPWA